MALRTLRLAQASATWCTRTVSAAFTSRSRTPGSAMCPGRADGYLPTPVRFISSDTMWIRLMKGKIVKSQSDSFQLPATVPTDKGEQISLLLRPPDQPENPRVLNVAIIGHANAGKSTLSNQLLSKKVFAVSSKVHTTRTRAMGVLTQDDTQIILLDTPGLTTPSKVKRHKLENSLLVDPLHSVKEADLVVVLVDVSDRWMCGQLGFEVLECLATNYNTPAVLVLNKVDLLKQKDKLLKITAELTCGFVNGRKINIRQAIKPKQKKEPTKTEVIPTEEPEAPHHSLSQDRLRQLRSQRGWPHFKEVFMLSAQSQEDVQALKFYLLDNAKPGEWQYHSQVLTDLSPQQICTNTIREKLLERLPQEVPYSVTQNIELWEENENGELVIAVKLGCNHTGHLGLVIGMGGTVAAELAQAVSEELSRFFMTKVQVRLWAVLKK